MSHLAVTRNAITKALGAAKVAILPPCDVLDALALFRQLELHAQCTILDPWYNKGIGGTRSDYEEFALSVLGEAARVSDHIFLWGFPEIVARFVERIPRPLELVCWLTWYYKNSPSVIRGWRSSQNACLHLAHPGAKLHPEHFLNAAQKEKLAEGKLRYMPGPTSVIEESLLCGFVGRDEQTGHPAQKPVSVFQKLILMTTVEGDLVFDPMCGSGTAGEASEILRRRAVISDQSEEYTVLAEERLGVPRVTRLHEQQAKTRLARDRRIGRRAAVPVAKGEICLPFQD
jgi:hypothetical protein